MSKPETTNVLLIEDNPGDARLICEYLRNRQEKKFEVLHVPTLSEGLEVLATSGADLVISDLGLPDNKGIETLVTLMGNHPMIPVIVITGINDQKLGLQAVKKGAQDFLVKEQIDEQVLVRAIIYAIERKKVEASLQERIKEMNVLHNMAIIAEISTTVEEYSTSIIDLIPMGFEEPERTCCKLEIERKIYEDAAFGECMHVYGADIIYNDRKIGRIEVGKINPRRRIDSMPFLEEEKEMMITIAKQIGDFAWRKHSDQVRQVMYNISTYTNTASSLEELMMFVQKQLSTLIDTTNFYIAMYDEVTDSISIPYFADQKDTITSFPAGKTLTAYVIRTRKPLLGKRADLDQLAASGKIETIGEKAAVWLGIPLLVKDKVIGVFAIQSYTDENAYSKDDLVMLEMISQQISISVERKKAENDLMQALDKAQEADRVKSAFLANMSHELRTPLNAVIGFSQLIDAETSMENVLEFTKHILKGGHQLLEIIEDILHVSLLEGGKIEVNYEKHSLTGIMDQVDGMIRDQQEKMQKQQVEIIYQRPEMEPDRLIYTDKEKLKEILMNLLKNALKFTPEGTIHYGFVEESREGKLWLKFYVRDTGIGISEEAQKIIFQLFRQAEESYTRTYGGTGLGLSVSRKLAEILGGTIWVESAEGKGSTFFVSHPFTEEISEVTRDVPAKEGQMIREFSERKILIAEDEESNYELLEILLSELDLSITWARNGREAVELCRDNTPIDLILMDLKMPMLNGYEATRMIRESHPRLPIIAQTAYAMPADRKEAIDAGCTDLLTKPINKEELLEMIHKYMPRS